MTLFVDLDGTLLDIRAKYLAVYRYFLTLHTQTGLSDSDFWALKRSAAENFEIAILSGVSQKAASNFSSFIQDHIETAPFLALDTLLPGIRETFESVAMSNFNVRLLTMRRNRQTLFDQLRRLQIRCWFESILEINHSENGGIPHKAISIKANCFKDPAMIIGDSGMDIKSGKFAGIATCAVTTGLRDFEVLRNYNPDIIVESFSEIIAILHNKAFNLRSVKL